MEAVTFQHLHTSNFTLRGQSCLTFYGRAATGESVAAHIHNIKPYGFFKINQAWWTIHAEQLYGYLQWFIADDKMSGMEKIDEQTEQGRSASYYRFQMLKKDGWLDKADTDMTVESVKGYGIRDVHEWAPDDFLKITCGNSNTLRALVKCLRNPARAHETVKELVVKLDKLAKPMPKRGPEESYEHWTTRCQTYLPIPPIPLPPAWDSVDMFETHVKSDLVYMIDNNLPACGWMTATYLDVNLIKPRSTCGIDINATSIRAEPNPPQTMAPYRLLSYDIESCPHVVEGRTETLFPEPDRDPILCIGVAVFNMVGQEIEQYCFMWEPEGGQCKAYPMLSEENQTDDYRPETTDVRSFRSEYDMLLAFNRFIQDEADPDIISGYNILNFDNVYTIQRAQHLYENLVQGLSYDEKKEIPRAWCWGRHRNRICTLKKQYKFSNQKGGKESWECRIEGREFMDLYKIIMDDHKLRSYKLDNVALEFLGTKKIKVVYDDIPIMQQTEQGRVELGVYCVKDAFLPCKMLLKMAKVLNAILMSQVTGVSLNTILNRGQQIRTVSLMLNKCKQRAKNGDKRWFLPDEDKPPGTGGFEGAVVITPIPGFYPDPVATLDFASLYPSIMRAYNMCFSTIINSPKEARDRGYKWDETMQEPSFRPVRTFDYPDGGQFKYLNRDDDVCFITNEHRKGILPEILAELLTERKATKKMMKSYVEGSMDYAVCDGRQLALKVCANSVYGFTGASRGFLPDLRIASSVTRVGRGMANETKFMCEDRYKEYGVRVVYGDSVSGDTPLLLMKNDEIFVENIQNLQLDTSPTFTWTENGWTEIKNKICHKLATSKKMLKVHTHTGIVKCTSDHSLVDATGNALFPSDVVVGETTLMQSWPSNYQRKAACVRFEDDIDMSVDFAMVLGMFMGNGSCGSYGTFASWAIINSDYTMLTKYQGILQNIFPKFEFKILDTIQMPGFYKLVPNSCTALVSFVERWRTLCYHAYNKKVPECILNAPIDIGSAFWSGLNDADGTSSEPEISQKGSIACLGIYTLLKSLGHDVVVDDIKPGVYRLRGDTLQNKNVVKKIVEIPHETYVYDLTTENHHFQAGVGNIIVHNTDSVFVHLPKTICDGKTKQDIIDRANQLGEEMAAMCTKAFLPPNDLEFEKIYYPLLLKGKKRYAGHKFEPGKKPNLDVKGFECVRRDFAPIVSRTQKEIFVLLCKENNVDAAVQHARQTVVNLLEGRVPLEDLILSKQLTRPPDQYKNPQPHVELAKYLQKILPPTQAPKTGDRIDYIIKPGRGKTCMRAAQPSDVTNGLCSTDNRWYLDNQLKEPLTRVFDMVIDNTSDIFRVDKIQAPTVGTNSMFASWVTSKRERSKDVKAENVAIKRRKVGKKKSINIKNFFS
jgi:DNA polymerase elongation subunit (family B)